MVIDTLGSIPSPQFADIKVERQPETGDTRAIEESEGSDNAQLYANRQENTGQQGGREVSMSGASEVVTYDSNGRITDSKVQNNPHKILENDDDIKGTLNKVVIE